MRSDDPSNHSPHAIESAHACFAFPREVARPEEIDYSKFRSGALPEEVDYSKFSQPTEPETVCQEANRIVYGDREQTYGHPAKNFEATARLWNAYIANKEDCAALDARDVARMMVLLKMARQQHQHKRDNLVDGIGYLACEAKIQDYEAR